jgi:hypothetical protein
MSNFEKSNRDRLLNCSKRLVRLLELSAPDVILIQEINMLNIRAISLFGEKIFSSIVNSVVCQQKFQFGYCMDSDCDKKLYTETELVEGLCNEHIEEEKKEQGENYAARIDIRKFD